VSWNIFIAVEREPGEYRFGSGERTGYERIEVDLLEDGNSVSNAYEAG